MNEEDFEQYKKDPNSLLPWVEKYRPTSFDELISHENILNTINQLIEKNELPHLLFYGPPGTGKTTSILAIARKLYGANYKGMTLELNASDDRKIETVRTQIKDFASTQKIFSSGVKLIILDEADAMTTAAQAALRRIIEKYTKNTRFCLICNYISKIIPAIQSRCTRFRFAPLEPRIILPRLEFICQAEKLKKVEKEGLEAIVKLSSGDMRKCLNILQSTYLAYDEITQENVYLCTGRVHPEDISNIFQSLCTDSFSEAFQTVDQLIITKCVALDDIVLQLHELILPLQLKDDDDASQRAKMNIFHQLAKIEENLASGAYYKIQLGALVGCFQIWARN